MAWYALQWGWYRDGHRHRENAPAFEVVHGKRAWYLRDELHRQDWPTIEDDGRTQEWYLTASDTGKMGLLSSGLTASRFWHTLPDLK